MAGFGGNQAAVHRAGEPVGKRILRIVQRQAARRMFERRDILLAEGSPRRHRAMAQVLQHRAAPQLAGIPTARAGKLDRSRMNAPCLASVNQRWCGARASNAGPCPTPPSRSNPSLYSLSNWYKISGGSTERRHLDVIGNRRVERLIPAMTKIS